MLLNFANKVVLITGGTRGIGLETALLFAQHGAQCILTYRWGDHDEDVICNSFDQVGGLRPILIQADASKKEDTQDLLLEVSKRFTAIDIFISNVSSAMVIKCFEDYTLKGLKQSLSCSTWPMVEYTKQIFNVFGSYPKYIVSVSSTGPDYFSIGYDYVATSKIVMEVFVKYMKQYLKEFNVVINAVRSRAIKTKLLEDTFGTNLDQFANQFVTNSQDFWLTADELANAIIALCSGYCDSINGQTITVDKGTSFFDNFMGFYSRYQKLNTTS